MSKVYFYLLGSGDHQDGETILLAHRLKLTPEEFAIIYDQAILMVSGGGTEAKMVDVVDAMKEFHFTPVIQPEIEASIRVEEHGKARLALDEHYTPQDRTYVIPSKATDNTQPQEALS